MVKQSRAGISIFFISRDARIAGLCGCRRVSQLLLEDEVQLARNEAGSDDLRGVFRPRRDRDSTRLITLLIKLDGFSAHIPGATRRGEIAVAFHEIRHIASLPPTSAAVVAVDFGLFINLPRVDRDRLNIVDQMLELHHRETAESNRQLLVADAVEIPERPDENLTIGKRGRRIAAFAKLI